VKFQVFWVKKTYKPSKEPYVYRGILLKVPKSFHGKIDPHIGKDFKMKSINIQETANEEIIDIILVRSKEMANAKKSNA
jgi:hypothetical protein